MIQDSQWRKFLFVWGWIGRLVWLTSDQSPLRLDA